MHMEPDDDAGERGQILDQGRGKFRLAFLENEKNDVLVLELFGPVFRDDGRRVFDETEEKWSRAFSM